MRAPSTVPRYLWDDENRPAVNRQTNQGMALTVLIWAGSSILTWRTGHVIWLASPAILVLSRVDQMMSMWVFRSRWWVYYLRDSTSELIYIGSTNDLQRRLAEHTDDRSEPWKRTIRAHTIPRICRSEKQARRIEERRIRAITVASKHAWCPPLRNKTWSTTAPKGLGILAARLWSWAYIVESVMYNEARWHAKPSTVWIVQRRPEPAEHAEEDWAEPGTIDDPPPSPNSERQHATYQRPTRPVTVIALGPGPAVTHHASVTDSHSPVGGGSRTHQRDNVKRDSTETDTERKRRLARERQARRRERQKGRP